MRGSIFTPADLPAWLLLFAVTFWIGGFDLIYACQDVEVDRREGLHSLPADFNVATALTLARICHLLTVALLAGVGAGAWTDVAAACESCIKITGSTLPDSAQADAYRKSYALYQELYPVLKPSFRKM